MKKMYFNSLIIFLLLAACSSPNESEKTQKPDEKTNEVKKAEPQKDVYVPNPQVTDDVSLVKVGETVTDAKGELTLKAIKQMNQTLKVGPGEVLIKDVKVMHFRPAYSMIDFFHAYTHAEEFDFIKVGIEVKNTSDQNIKINPVAYLKTNSGEHKTWEDDIYLENLATELPGKSTKKGSVGFILEKTKEYKSVEILTSDVLDSKGKHIAKAKKTEVKFE